MLRRARRPLTALFALGLAAVTAGCTTFSDNDAVARVNAVEFSRDAFEAQLTDAGVAPDQAANADAVRDVITTWIQEELATLPVDEAALEARYDAGIATSGHVCLAAVVVVDEAAATDVDARLDAGESFDDLFTAHNIDQQLATTGGDLPCLSAAEIETASGVPFVELAKTLDATTTRGTAPLLDASNNEIAWVVLRFRPFAELTDEEIAGISTGAADADVHVDPRFGTFDARTGQVVALG